MEGKDLANKIFEIKSLLEKNEGIALFVDQEKGFEGWIKVELCGILNKYGKVQAEKKRIDIIFDDEWAISLKDEKANFYEGKSSIFDNINELKDKKKPYSRMSKTCLLFLTFPDREITDDNIHIQTELDSIHKIHYHKDFEFNNKIKGRIWFVIG